MRGVKRNWCPATVAVQLFIVPSLLAVQATRPSSAPEQPGDQPVVIHHQITLDGKALTYAARGGHLSVRDECGKLHRRFAPLRETSPTL